MVNQNILLKGMWSLEDIQTYCGCCKTKASQIRQKALKLGGGTELSSHLIQRDKVLEALGLDPHEEKELLKAYYLGTAESKKGVDATNDTAMAIIDLLKETLKK